MQGMWEVCVLRPDTVAKSREVQMRTVLGITVLGTMLAAAGGVVAVGWAYEGPKRFIRRLRLRKALR